MSGSRNELENLARRLWDTYSVAAGHRTFDGKPLPTWDELGEDRQKCWLAVARVASEPSFGEYI